MRRIEAFGCTRRFWAFWHLASQINLKCQYKDRYIPASSRVLYQYGSGNWLARWPPFTLINTTADPLTFSNGQLFRWIRHVMPVVPDTGKSDIRYRGKLRRM